MQNQSQELNYIQQAPKLISQSVNFNDKRKPQTDKTKKKHIFSTKITTL